MPASSSAERSREFSAYALGKLFLKGDEVPKNVGCALQWLEEAVVKENQYAEYLLGKTLLMGVDTEQDMERGVQLLTASAGQKNCCAQYTLGKAYLEGVLLPQNIPESIRLLSESADFSSFAPAQYLLGKLLYRGEIVMRDIGRGSSVFGAGIRKRKCLCRLPCRKNPADRRRFQGCPESCPAVSDRRRPAKQLCRVSARLIVSTGQGCGTG
ncbi:MAG: tetratricopeptide repeat protein [Clostridia bacterium]